MSRFLLGLLLAGVLFWGYDRWFADEGAAQETGAPLEGDGLGALERLAAQHQSGSGDAPGPGESTGEDPPGTAEAEVSPAPLIASGTASLAEVKDLTLEQFFAALDAGEPKVRAVGFELLRRLPVTDGSGTRARLAKGLTDRVAGAKDAEQALELLGTNNGFLHTEEGRRAAERVLQMLLDLPDNRALAVGTGLLARCMRGPIEQNELQAKALVDKIYRAHLVRVGRYLCDPTNLQGARQYETQGGDLLSGIASRFSRELKVPLSPRFLALVNRIHNPNVIKKGQRIKIPTSPLRIVLEKRSYLMALYLGGSILRLYWIGHGTDDSTPVATFRVSDLLENPAWYAPNGEVYPHGHPENILGGYFVKLAHAAYTGYGVHGTPDPMSVGAMASAGCIRMWDKDIQEFFGIVPVGVVFEIRASR